MEADKNMEKYLKIGEMAMLNHVSTQTLRLYAKNKLLEPEYLDKETGYRYYTLDQCARLDLIHALKSCRLSLEDIRKIFSLSSPEELAVILKEQELKLEKELYNLSISRNTLSRLHKNLQIQNALPPFGTPYFEYQEERCIAVHHTNYNFSVDDYSGYKQMIREMQNYLFENQLSPSYFINIGTIITQENFEAKHLTTHLAFVFVDNLYPVKEDLHLLPSGMYIAMASDDPSLEIDYANKLYEEIERQGMRTSGDYICEVLNQFPFYRNEKLVYKIQIPVAKK